jgi:hypothetical protein
MSDSIDTRQVLGRTADETSKSKKELCARLQRT